MAGAWSHAQCACHAACAGRTICTVVSDQRGAHACFDRAQASAFGGHRGLALTVLAFVVPEARTRWLIHVVEVLYFYSAFWGIVDMHQRGLLNKRPREIDQDVKRSPRRTRFESAAFSLAGAVLLLMYR